VIQVPLVSVQGEQQPAGFGVFGHEFIERQIDKPKRFVGILGASVAGRDDCEECLRVHCEYSASVGVKRER
jgi:hypothetical protein